MSFQFDSNDYMTTGGYTTRPQLITISIWVIRTAHSFGGAGRLLTGELGGDVFLDIADGSAGDIGFLRGFAEWDGGFSIRQQTTEADYDGTTWHHILMTYDGSAAGSGNAPVLYRDGSSVPVTNAGDSSGTRVTTTGNWEIGNRSSDVSRGHVGYIAEPAIYDRILTSGQISALAAGKSPMDTGQVGANPLWYNRMKDGVGGANAQVGTLTNGGGENTATLQSGTNPTVDDPPSETVSFRGGKGKIYASYGKH